MRSDQFQQRLPLIGTAIFALLWVTARAHVQAITIDEAVTYMNFVAPGGEVWSPHANNHVLNSALMRVFTTLFGLSHITVRSGALIGAALYIAAAYRLCRWIAPHSIVVQWPLFVCLVYNPFVLDFMVAARGYGLATAFLMWAIAVVATFEMRNSPDTALKPMVIVCGSASVLVALSFVANFSFAFVDAATLGMTYLWVCGWIPAAPRHKWPLRKYLQLAVACVLPGLLVTAALAGPIVVHFPKEELVYGAGSFRETLRSLSEASLYEVNPHLGYKLVSGAERVGALLFPLLGAIGAIRLAVILFSHSSAGDRHARWLRALAGVVAGAVALTISFGWLAFRMSHILWPKDRTAIYLVVMATLMAGLLVAIPVPTRWGELSRYALTATLFAFALYFLLCLRIGHFKEWKWNADADKVYAVLARYNHACGVKEVPVNWRYDASMNFYRTLSGRESFNVFQPYFGVSFQRYPGGKLAYVLYDAEDQDFIREQRLTVVYRSEVGSTVAIDPIACGAAKMGRSPIDIARDFR